MKFEAELKRLGLADKEVAVYLACLQLGPSPVQAIGRKAKVVRATTYVILESLMQQGLVTTYKEGKKTLFSAEPPRQLLRLLEKQEEEIREKKHDLERILPELQIITKAEGTPSVRYFEGKEGLHAIRQEIVMYSRSGDVIYNFTPSDHLAAVFPDNESTYYQQRLAKGIRSQTIFTTKSSRLAKLLLSPEQFKSAERRFVPSEIFSSTSGLTVYRDRIAIGNFVGKLMGVVIESAPMADMMRQLFNLAWQGTKNIPQESVRNIDK